MKKRKIKKSTGQIRQTKIELSPGRPAQLSEVKAFSWPSSKNEAEELVMRKFHSLCYKASFLPAILHAEKFPTDHGPDFVLQTLSGTSYAELVEIALLDGPYETASRVRTVSEFLDHCCLLIRTKENKYRNKQFKPLILIMYVGDDAFSPNEEQTMALRHVINNLRSDVFEQIFLMLFGHDGSPLAIKMFPTLSRMTNRQVRLMRKKQMICLDPRDREILSGGMNEEGQIHATFEIIFPRGTNLENFTDEEINRLREQFHLKSKKLVKDDAKLVGASLISDKALYGVCFSHLATQRP